MDTAGGSTGIRLPAPSPCSRFRTACWLRVRMPTVMLRLALQELPPTRVLRHRDFVHVLYDVDGWRAWGVIAREHVVARVRGCLFADAILHEIALGHFVCETNTACADRRELLRARLND